MLEAALTEPQVKRIVITSSVVVVEPKNGFDRIGRESLPFAIFLSSQLTPS